MLFPFLDCTCRTNRLPDFAPGTIQRNDLETLAAGIRAEETANEAQRTKLTGMIQERDNKLDTLTDYTTRARGGFCSVYCAGSKQYKQAGGTITSERKPPKRKPKAN